nr:translation initiation factor IF-2-like [Aegilops tauschii subsp. strangulata]
MPDVHQGSANVEVVPLVNFFSNCKLSETECQFGKESACHSAAKQRFLGQTADGAPAPGHQYLADRVESDADDPELGAAAVEKDDAVGGGGEGAGGSTGGGLGDWPDDDEGDDDPRHAPGADRPGASSSAAPTAVGGAPKRRADAGLFGSRSKNTKTSAAATNRHEASAKAALFQKAPKRLPLVSAAPLSLPRASSGSVIGAANGSAGPRRVDPLADLQEAMEKNAREAREEREAAAREKAEAAKAAQAEADAATKAQADAAAREQADAAAKAHAEEASRSRAPESTGPQHAYPPVPEGQAPIGEAAADLPALEKGGATPLSWGRRCPRTRRLP